MKKSSEAAAYRKFAEDVAAALVSKWGKTPDGAIDLVKQHPFIVRGAFASGQRSYAAISMRDSSSSTFIMEIAASLAAERIAGHPAGEGSDTEGQDDER